MVHDATDNHDVRNYNYAIFPPTSDAGHFARFAEHLKVGAEAPDSRLTLLANDPVSDPVDNRQEVQLSDYWQDANLVVEFGSFT